jgi:predicted AlkP superfamily phosphohydrolase/phosphomutase
VFLHGGLFVLDDDRREEIVDELEEATASFTEEDGERVVDELHHCDSVYDGEHMEAGPDLVPIASDYKLLGFSDEEGLFDPDDAWIAAHEMDGVFVASGPDFGSASDVTLDLCDIAPTLLSAMEFHVPEDMDGRVCRDLLRGGTDIETRRPLASRHQTELTEEDRDRMNERLKQLGYMD